MVKRRRVKKVVEEEGAKKLPVGVQIISVWYYILAALCVLVGLFIIIGANAIISLLIESAPELESVLTGGVIIGVGLILIGIGVLCFFVGRGLWKLKQWAKILAIIFAITGIVLMVYSMITGFAFLQVVRFAINVAIGAYLIFSKEAKGIFK